MPSYFMLKMLSLKAVIGKLNIIGIKVTGTYLA